MEKRGGTGSDTSTLPYQLLYCNVFKYSVGTYLQYLVPTYTLLQSLQYSTQSKWYRRYRIVNRGGTVYVYKNQQNQVDCRLRMYDDDGLAILENLLVSA